MGPDGQGFDDKRDEQVLDLVAGQRDQLVGVWPVGMLLGADDSKEGVGEHGEGDPAAPGGVAAELVFIEPGQALLGLEGLLHSPPEAGRPDQGAQRDQNGGMAAVVGGFAGGAVASDQGLPVSRRRVGEVDDGPVVERRPFAPGPAASFCQARFASARQRGTSPPWWRLRPSRPQQARSPGRVLPGRIAPCGRGLLDQPGRRLQSRDAAPQQHRLTLPTGPPVHRWQTALTPRSG